MAGNYSVWLSDAFGNHLATLDTFTALVYTRVRNDAGVLNITMPPSFDFRLFRNTRDARIEVYRGVDGGPQRLDTETVWFVEMDDEQLSQLGADTFTVTARSAATLLSRRIIAYYAGSAQAAKSGPADDVMKAIIRENFGSLATDTLRDLSAYLSVQADASAGPTITKQFARRTVLTVLQEIADAAKAAATAIFFDIVSPAPATLEFRTYKTQRGMDRTFLTGGNPVLLGPQFGNLTNPRLVHDYTTEVNYVYAGGQGNLDQRAIATSFDTTRIAVSPFNRREKFRQATAATTVSQLQAEADAELLAGLPLVALTGKLLNTPATQYGKDWKWGDRLTMTAFNQRLDVHVHGITVSVTQGAEDIQADLRVA